MRREDEINLIQIAVYYVLSTLNERGEEKASLDRCVQILKKELFEREKNETFFYFQGAPEHILNKLSRKIDKSEENEYNKLLKKVILKMDVYANYLKEYNPIMDVCSNEEVESLAYEIFYFDKSIDELEKEENKYAKYELGRRYLKSGLLEDSYKLFEEASKLENIKAKIKKYECIYLLGTNQDKKMVLKELEIEREKGTLRAEGFRLLGKIYYYIAESENELNTIEAEENERKAFECFEECKDSIAEANLYLGLMHTNEEEACKRLEEAIKMGNLEAFNTLIKRKGHIWEWRKKKEYYEDESLSLNNDFKFFTDAPDNINEIAPEDYPISVTRALKIANKDENLKTDYAKAYQKEYHRMIGLLEFTDKEIEIVEINNRKYWKIQVTNGKMGSRDKRGRFFDGRIVKSDLLVCLIDVETGEYIYYPQNINENKKEENLT